jgi:hypothetical protein
MGDWTFIGMRKISIADVETYTRDVLSIKRFEVNTGTASAMLKYFANAHQYNPDIITAELYDDQWTLINRFDRLTSLLVDGLGDRKPWLDIWRYLGQMVVATELLGMPPRPDADQPST